MSDKKINYKISINTLALALALGLAVSGSAAAIEPNQASIYPIGVENYGCCALPPPGIYGMVYGGNLEMNKVVDNNGNTTTPSDFKITVNAIVPRFIWITPVKVGEASLGVHAIMPLIDKTVTAGGVSAHHNGLGDMTFGPVLGWHHSPNLHNVLALDILAPTGQYTYGDAANIGVNHWAIQPVVGVSYMDPNGLNADLKAMYTYNLRNTTTNYKNGQELTLDYSLGWGVGSGWTLGVGGYVYRQITNDQNSGSYYGGAVSDKAKAIAIGPSIRYDSGKGWFLTAKYTTDSNVRNYTEGKAFWVKAVFPL
jgi:hypothetical protein